MIHMTMVQNGLSWTAGFMNSSDFHCLSRTAYDSSEDSFHDEHEHSVDHFIGNESTDTPKSPLHHKYAMGPGITALSSIAASESMEPTLSRWNSIEAQSKKKDSRRYSQGYDHDQQYVSNSITKYYTPRYVQSRIITYTILFLLNVN